MKRRALIFIIVLILSITLIIYLVKVSNFEGSLSPSSEDGGLMPLGDPGVSLSPSEGYIQSSIDSLTIGNSKVEFTFNGSTNGNISISQLKNLETGRVFQTNNNEILKISLRNDSFVGEYSLTDLNYQFSYSTFDETPGPGK